MIFEVLSNSEVLRNGITQRFWKEFGISTDIYRYVFGINTNINAGCFYIKETTELDMEQWTGSKLGKEYVKAVYCHPAYLTYMQSTSC